ncbi:diaminopimelate epimerase [Planctomycetales bacterium]|nr:diaminopimelate epimerase [Planctomycetales bacterium]
MPKINFTKMQGCGNDFILLDNRERRWTAAQKIAFTKKFATRRLSVGADGVIFLENAPPAPADNDAALSWDFYNADGSNAEMCGNGARCFTLFAVALGAAVSPFTFATRAGNIRAEISAPQRARVQLPPALAPTLENLSVDGAALTGYFLNTGVPHLVVNAGDRDALEKVEVQTLGAALRYHERFAPAGTNVDFIAVQNGETWVRTYERGVEAETLACGTGAVASAIIAGEKWGGNGKVHTRGGDRLNVEYQRAAAGYAAIFLEGPAVAVFDGAVEWDLELKVES